MTEIFPIDDTPMRPSDQVSFVLFFKAFQQAEALEKQPAVPN
jgi:hypothetical protein